jgi:hypothetical protein
MALFVRLNRDSAGGCDASGPADCRHAELCVRGRRGLDEGGAITIFGFCPTCQMWLVITTHGSGRVDTRLFTPDDLDCLDSYENRHRCSVWLANQRHDVTAR